MEFTAKTVEEAVQEGLKELGVDRKNAVITVLEEPTKGLFGRLKGKARVDIEKIELEKTEEEKVSEFVQGVLKHLDLNASVEVFRDDKNTVIKLVSDDSANVIGYRGEVLDAIQTLSGAFVNIGKKEYQKVVVDCENYREKREDTLVKLAKKLEEKATEIRREVILEPMSSYERRIIHTALASSTTVVTRSDGKDPNRYVVIVPNDKDEFSKPYNAGRNRDKNRRDNRRDGNKNGRNRDKGRRDSRSGSSSGEKRKSPSVFGTYLGNSLKDN